MAYSDKVIDHYENPRNVGSMSKEDSDVGSGRWAHQRAVMDATSDHDR